MVKIECLLEREAQKLKKIVEQVQKRLQSVPEGYLRITKKRNGVEYYIKGVGEKGGNGRYLKKNESTIAKSIAQRDYDVQLLKSAEERIKAINNFLSKYKKTSIESIYQKTNPARRALIDTAILSDDEFVKRWQEMEYKGKPFAEDAPEIITERGERVRSKSEKIIGDKLNALGIAYRYEYPLALGNVTVYPDFTILKMPERKVVYLEHFGLMDDSDYVDKAMQKLTTYERNGIYLGVNLFITHETQKNPLNTRGLDAMLRSLFCSE